MRTGLLTAAVLLTSASAALAVEPIELEQVASGFTAPIHLEEPNDGTGRLFFVDQVGTIWIIMPDAIHPAVRACSNAGSRHTDRIGVLVDDDSTAGAG